MNRQIAACRRQGLVEEEPAIVGDGLTALKQVLEGRHFRALGMAALLRLLQLLRVAEEDDALGRLRDRKDVRKRHLPGLVHEEHVDGIAEVGARPHPGSAGRQLSLASGDARKKCGVVGQLEDLPAGVLRIALDLLGAAQVDSFVRRSGDRLMSSTVPNLPSAR